jgi:hypothetical protein
LKKVKEELLPGYIAACGAATLIIEQKAVKLLLFPSALAHGATGVKWNVPVQTDCSCYETQNYSNLKA